MMRMLVLVVCIGCGGPPRPAASRGHADEETVVARDEETEERRETGPSPALTCETYDAKNPACRGDPRFGDGKCPDPPDRDNPWCWAVMLCPNPPDRRIRACHTGQDCFEPSCAKPPGPIIARTIKAEVIDGDLIVTLAAGSDQGITRAWKGVVLAGETDQKLVDVEILRIAKHQIIARVHLSREEIETNPRVRLTPPN